MNFNALPRGKLKEIPSVSWISRHEMKALALTHLCDATHTLDARCWWRWSWAKYKVSRKRVQYRRGEKMWWKQIKMMSMAESADESLLKKNLFHFLFCLQYFFISLLRTIELARARDNKKSTRRSALESEIKKDRMLKSELNDSSGAEPFVVVSTARFRHGPSMLSWANHKMCMKNWSRKQRKISCII